MPNALLDVIFIGPYDLSLSLGYPPPSPDPHPDVEKTIQHILQVTHGAGKKWYTTVFFAFSELKVLGSAIFCSSGTQGARRSAEGFDMVGNL